ncbi:Pal1 cell morphology protein-domain-containing protein [Calycina marina]|uniref:Pal1 cell morphology protein-domain-containing protein n=1 Tax=Calycina marina TaxID=1763456 RepID=A0A9P8CE53_9HELO|nr:Pal1 cell morphology protein-domain-containing protein [Calycina marina]
MGDAEFKTNSTLQDNLTLEDQPKRSNGSITRPPTTRSNTNGQANSSRGENLPPRGPPRGLPPGHRPTRSQEDAMRARRAATGLNNRVSQPKGELDIFADPSPQKGRARRNSESSVGGKSLDEDEKRRQERRRRERRHREEGKRSGSRPKKPDRKLDIIDKLDVTSIYGTGLFHHDGPFDACNPHRNRGSSRRAPMQAFPKDSLNNALGGGGPLNKKPDHATFLGNNDDEAFRDYSRGGAAQNGYEPYGNGEILPRPKVGESTVISATTRVEPIHGEESLGLGTSTFLEGAPASRTAMQRRESETVTPIDAPGGLGRKKSLAQKIRGINNRREYGGPRGVASPGVHSPSGMGSPQTPVYTPGGPQTPVYTPGGTQVDGNPFFNEFSKGDDNKEIRKETVTFVEPVKSRAPTSPKGYGGGSLERRVTSDGSGSGVEQLAKPSGGFLARVKSLKGGPRKQKPMDKISAQLSDY